MVKYTIFAIFPLFLFYAKRETFNISRVWKQFSLKNIVFETEISKVIWEREREMFEFLDNIREEKNKHLDNDEKFLIFWENSPVVSCCKEV